MAVISKMHKGRPVSKELSTCGAPSGAEDSTMGEQVTSGGAGAGVAPHGNGGQGDEHGQADVKITINNITKQIHRGRQTVVAIKTLGGVPQADELAQVIEGNTPPLTPLKDDASVTIKGGEIFVSYPRDSGSSN